MAGRLSFSIAINLLTENFKRGTSQVKNAFRSMQAQIFTFAAALGVGGIGLSNLVTRFVEVARETSRVTTSLKNVSGSMAQYADNQKFLLDMAQKYGLEINALTGNYAKFTAAASISGMSMEEQRKIFESMSRAVTAFGMSADDSNGVFMALSQMMSKGKISSEELRLQMGERLPIALQAMAKAAGVSVAGLDKLLKQGKLMSADVLPKFADALNEMIPNVDTDNLETSVNRLKNTFTELVNSSGVQSSYKSLIDWLTGAIQTAAENIRNIVIGLLALITGAVANHAAKWWTSISALTTSLEASAVKSNAVLLQATQQRIAAEIALEKAKTQSVAAESRARMALDRALQKEQLALTQVADAEQKAADVKKVASAQTTAKLMIKATQERVASEIALETAKTELVASQNANRQAQTYNESITIRKRLEAAQSTFASAEKNLAEKTAKEIAAMEAAKAAAAESAAVKSQTSWSRFCSTTKVAVGKLVISLRTLWSTFAPMVIVSVIIALIGKFVEMRREAERVKNIFSEYKKELSSVGNTSEIAQLRVLQKLYNEATGNKKLQEQYQKRIEGIVGEQIKKEQKINDVVRERIGLLVETAKAEKYAQEIADKETLIKGIGTKTYNGYKVSEMAPDWGASRGDRKKTEAFKQKYGVINGFDELGFVFGDMKNDLNSYLEYANILKDAKKGLDGSIRLTTKKTQNNTNMDPPADPDKKKKKTPLQKEQGSYFKQYEELGAELGIGKITQAEYNKALGELNIKMYAQAKGTGDKEVLESEYFKLRKEAAEKAVTNMEHTDAMVELEKVQKDYNVKVKEVSQQHDKGLISQKELNENLLSLSVDAGKSAAGIKGIGDSADGFITAMSINAKLYASPIKIKPRDTTFDYKKTEADIASENLDKAKELADKLKEQFRSVGKELDDEMANAMAKVPSFEDALKIAQVKQDIKDLSQEISEAKWDGMKSAVSNIDGMVSAFQRLKDAFDPDSEADGWERLMALWNSFTSVVDGIMSVVKVIENITELTNKLTKAKEAEGVVDTTVTAVKVANAITGTTAETTALGTQTAAEVAANATKTATATTAMAAASTAAYAYIPFAGPVLAAGQIAAMKAMIMAAAVPFATGGIIKNGPISGDRILARVNAGEMILNGSQQANLFDAINSGKLGGGNTTGVTIGFDKVRGSDIYLSLKNYMKSTGNKL